MSFSLTHDFGRYEYGGSGANCYFGQRSNIASPRHWMLLKEINRFFSSARERVEKYHRDTPLGEFLSREHYSQDFIEDHILPMGAAIWSSPVGDMLAFPARSFVEFYANHGLLQFRTRPLWRTVAGGSRTYVERLIDDSTMKVVTNARLKSIVRRPERVMVETEDGVVHLFDHVVMAAHADQTLSLLADADAIEQPMLSAFRYQKNVAVLHRDRRWMPRRDRLWSSWNYLKTGRGGDGSLCVSYWMNRLQNLQTRDNLFVTLNPMTEIDQKQIIDTFDYDHPVFDAAAFRAQENMASIQGHRRTWYCGSYLGYGFHEDGIASGLAVAEELGGIARPWTNDDRFVANAQTQPIELQVAE